jgi:hypothetical protein
LPRPTVNPHGMDTAPTAYRRSHDLGSLAPICPFCINPEVSSLIAFRGCGNDRYSVFSVNAVRSLTLPAPPAAGLVRLSNSEDYWTASGTRFLKPLERLVFLQARKKKADRTPYEEGQDPRGQERVPSERGFPARASMLLRSSTSQHYRNIV